MRTYVTSGLISIGIVVIGFAIYAGWAHTDVAAPQQGATGEPTVSALDGSQLVPLRIGETAAITDTFSISLQAVSKDSRCPVHTYCLYPGTVRTDLVVTRGQEREQYELAREETISVPPYAIRLHAVSPSRYAHREVQPIEYQVTYKIMQ